MQAGADFPHHFLQHDGEILHGDYVEYEDGTYVVDDNDIDYEVWQEETIDNEEDGHHVIHYEDTPNRVIYDQKVHQTFQVKREHDDQFHPQFQVKREIDDDSAHPVLVGQFEDEEDADFYAYSYDDMYNVGYNNNIEFVEFHDASANKYRRLTVAECQFCGVILKHPSKIQAHMRTHTGEKPFECELCKMKFSQKTPWANHMRKHAGDLPYECSYGCGKRFVNNARKNAHELRHRGLKRQGPPRPHLKPPRRRMPNVERERAVVNKSKISNVPLPEERCPIVEWEHPTPEFHPPISAAASKRIDEVIEAVVSGESLTRRKHYKHRSAIIAQCHICGLMLKHPSKIQAHMRTHTGEKPFACETCALHFSNMYSLRMHIKRKHDKGGRDMACRWDCGMKFVSAGARNEHERVVHSGIKRYECTALGCRRMFTRRHYLMLHRQKEHGLYTPIFDPNEVRHAEQQEVIADEAEHEIDAEIMYTDEFLDERVIEVDENGVVIGHDDAHFLEAEYIDEGDEVVDSGEIFMEYPDLEGAEYVEPVAMEEYFADSPLLEPKIELEQSVSPPLKTENTSDVQETVKQVWMNNDNSSRRCISVRILKRGPQTIRSKKEE